MAQAVRYFTEVLLDGHIPLHPGITQGKITPGAKVGVIVMLEDGVNSNWRASWRASGEGLAPMLNGRSGRS